MTEPTFQLWSAPNPRVLVYIHTEAMQRLHTETKRGLKLLGRRGVEIGGILLGTASTSGGVRNIFIQGVEPVEVSFHSGPTWKLTEEERGQLRQKVEISRRAAPERRVVGMFRSNRRADGGLSGDDLETYAACCPEPYDIFVVAHPGPGGAVLAEVAWREGGIVCMPQSTPIAMPPLLPPESQPPRSRSRWALPLVLLVCSTLLAATVALGVYSYQKLRYSATSRPAAPLGLHLERQGDHLVLTWDRATAPVQAALSGRLTIDDGPYQRNVELSASQVRAGRIFYQSGSNEVEFRLEIEQEGGWRVAESLRFLSGARPTKTPVDLPRSTASRSRVPDRSAVAAAVPPASFEPKSADRKAPPSRPQFVPPAQANRPVQDAQQLDAPPAEVLTIPQADVPLLPAGNVRLQPPPVPAATIVEKKASPPPPAAPVSPKPKPDTSYAEPLPVHQVRPILPLEVRTALHGRAEIQVKVMIDVQGKVTEAAIASENGPLTGYLRDAVLTAARQWLFTPARANGHVLPSQKILDFVITGK